MPDPTKLLINILISLIALLTFVILYGVEIVDTWSVSIALDPPVKEKLAYFATAAAGLVAAVVATALSIPAPTAGATETAAEAKRRSKTFRGLVTRLGDSIAGTGDEKEWKEKIAAAYIIMYMLVSIVAIATWIFQNAAADLIKAEALTSFGLFLAAAKSFLTDQRANG